jgi:hypothetical protein
MEKGRNRNRDLMGEDNLESLKEGSSDVKNLKLEEALKVIKARSKRFHVKMRTNKSLSVPCLVIGSKYPRIEHGV